MNLTSETIRRITLTGNMEDDKKSFDYCRKNKYHIIRTGPVEVGNGMVDITRYKIVAEKIVRRGTKIL